ncbi:MAG: DUF4159 domain-containing protein [Candidatus Cloacimonadaceae bacterium]|nr:DUF4159 domain-containing protein [Candidatus Cloacimonadaceae bacterium]MDP3113291.1 DUF4159 domain-containing protein [Candidatus Cloacimonadaceae bacterium]
MNASVKILCILLIAIAISISTLGGITGTLTRTGFARLQYDGGGDWYNDPEVLPNLARYVNSLLNTNFPIDQAVVKASDAKLFEYPFVYLTGHGNIRFTDREIENLRQWMLRGGFLYADDDYGMDQSFRREIKRIFPEYQLTELDPSFPLFTRFFDFSAGLPKIHKHDEKPPQAYGIFDENGRLMTLYTYESNISDGWADYETHKNPPEVRETALRFGANIVYYVMTR